LNTTTDESIERRLNLATLASAKWISVKRAGIFSLSMASFGLSTLLLQGRMTRPSLQRIARIALLYSRHLRFKCTKEQKQLEKRHFHVQALSFQAAQVRNKN